MGASHIRRLQMNGRWSKSVLKLTPKSEIGCGRVCVGKNCSPTWLKDASEVAAKYGLRHGMMGMITLGFHGPRFWDRSMDGVPVGRH